MGRSAARRMDIEADNLLSTVPKIRAGDAGCCYESPVILKNAGFLRCSTGMQNKTENVSLFFYLMGAL